ncbi:MAG: hypothetical protein AABZ55_12290 [Bdellovibrionota bacterium]
MIKKMILGLGVLSLLSAGAMASEIKGACQNGRVIHLLRCRSTLMQGGHGVSLCSNEAKTFADVTGVVAQGGRTGVIATYVVKKVAAQGVGSPTLYVDKKTKGKDLELAIPTIAPRPNGGLVGHLTLQGRVQPELSCRYTK